MQRIAFHSMTADEFWATKRLRGRAIRGLWDLRIRVAPLHYPVL
jgi:hypothetical protein